MIGQAQLYDMRTLRGHPPFLLIKGPYGINSNWEPLSPPASKNASTSVNTTTTTTTRNVGSNFENEKLESR